jgi:SAM-dependent methyltransferase
MFQILPLILLLSINVNIDVDAFAPPLPPGLRLQHQHQHQHHKDCFEHQSPYSYLSATNENAEHRELYGEHNIHRVSSPLSTPSSIHSTNGSYDNTGKNINISTSTNSRISPAIINSTSASRKQFLSNLISATSFSLIALPSTTLFPQQAMATYIDPKTKINLPSIGEIEEAIPSNWDDIDNPFIDSNSKNKNTNIDSTLFTRLDNTNDSIFYNEPRFVEHIDENAVSIIEEYISKNTLGKNMDVLDLCSSWTSHISTQTKDKLNLQRVAGLGMNEQELKSNNVLTDYTVMNLNMKKSTDKNQIEPLPYDDCTFDVVLCQLSIDYLIYPLEVMTEVGRVLKKGGKVVILFSNRLFLQKAVGLWTGADDIDHAFIVGSYLFFSDGNFDTNSIAAKDLSKRNKKGMIVGDPLYVVSAMKKR